MRLTIGLSAAGASERMRREGWPFRWGHSWHDRYWSSPLRCSIQTSLLAPLRLAMHRAVSSSRTRSPQRARWDDHPQRIRSTRVGRLRTRIPCRRRLSLSPGLHREGRGPRPACTSRCWLPVRRGCDQSFLFSRICSGRASSHPRNPRLSNGAGANRAAS
jgi:hypothetical protein